MSDRCRKPMPEGYHCRWLAGHEGECGLAYNERMDADYYGFELTGVEPIDRILSAVASAGKGYHHTEYWSDEFDGERDIPPFRGRNYIEWIQNAANDAAQAFRAAISSAGAAAGRED